MKIHKAFCDHCGKELDAMKDYDDVKIELGHLWREHDLCADCLEELKELVDKFCTNHPTEKGGAE